MSSSTSRKYYEIVGCAPKNLGDVLMLEAVIQDFKLQLPDWRPCVGDIRVRQASSHSKEIGLVAQRERGWVKRARTHLSILAARAAEPIQMVDQGEIGAIIDVCGYKYGGLWGNDALNIDLPRYRDAAANGLRIVLMPKTFGPFEGVARDKICDLVRSVTACFVRDSESVLHLEKQGLIADRDFEQFPDFTADVSGVPATQSAASTEVVLVPNINMIKSRRFPDIAAYVQHLAHVARCAARFGPPGILAHHLGKDRIICRELARALDAPIVDASTARHAKGVIGKARFVYSDRLHGLVNGLSQGVPSLTCGWSHKYEEMLKDWDVPTLMLNPHTDPASIERKVATVFDQQMDIKARLQRARENILLSNALMWEKIAKALP